MGLGDDCMRLCEDVLHTAVAVFVVVVRWRGKNKVHRAEEKTCGVAHEPNRDQPTLIECGQPRSRSKMLGDAYLDVCLRETLLGGTESIYSEY